MAALRVTFTLGRYFGMRFLVTAVAVFAGVVFLVALLDAVELMRRTSANEKATAWMVIKLSMFRVPMMAERIMPFCALIGAMSCYLNLSRRNELVVARAAGISAWEFTAPAVIVALALGAFATLVYNPVAANLQELAKRYESDIFGQREFGQQQSGFWVRQRSTDGQSIINARDSREQGMRLTGVSIFTFDPQGRFQDRIEARAAVLGDGVWELSDARIYSSDAPPSFHETYRLKTNISREQVRETFATPETLSLWELPEYIRTAENAGMPAAGYRLQYQKLLSRPFLLASMVLLAAAFSLRFARMGGVQKMVLGGVLSGFLLYVLSKITEDMTKTELLSPVTAAWIPVVIGGLTGFLVLLYQEDG
jgi:lipopolysaccharide export system permease protein